MHLFPHFHRPFQPPPQVLCKCGPLSGCSASPRSFSWCLLTLPSSVQRCFLLVEAVPSDHGRTLPSVPEVYSEHLLLSPSWGWKVQRAVQTAVRSTIHLPREVGSSRRAKTMLTLHFLFSPILVKSPLLAAQCLRVEWMHT